MSKNFFIGINNVARKGKNLYVGVNGVARKVKAAYIGVNGVARQFWPTQIFAPEVGITMAGTGWGGYAREGSPYRAWYSVLSRITNSNSASGVAGGGGRGFLWTMTSVGGFDLLTLPRYVGSSEGTNGSLIGGAIGPLPAGSYRIYWWVYNSDSSHIHDAYLRGVGGTVYINQRFRSTGTRVFYNGIITIPEQFYVWQQYSTDDGWANEYGNGGFTLVGA